MSFPQLRTARLRLTEIEEDDAPALFAIHGDVDAMRWYGSDPPTDLAGARRLVQVFAHWRTLPNPGVRWKLARPGDPTLIGTCGFMRWERSAAKCMLGYELHPACQGQGLMHEALVAALDWGFDAMALNRIEAQVHPDNAASRRVLQRVGFVEEGRLRQAGFWQGRFQDLLHYALLREDWPVAETTIPAGAGIVGEG